MTNEEKELEEYYKYINEIKRQLAEIYLFKAVRNPDNTIEYITQEIPDGEYPMIIKGKTDYIQVKDGNIYCYKWESQINEKQ